MDRGNGRGIVEPAHRYPPGVRARTRTPKLYAHRFLALVYTVYMHDPRTATHALQAGCLLAACDTRFLSLRDRRVLVLRACGLTLEQVAERLAEEGCYRYSRERIRQIERAASYQVERRLADTPPGFYWYERFP